MTDETAPPSLEGPPAVVISSTVLTGYATGALLTMSAPTVRAYGSPIEQRPVFVGFLDQEIARQLADHLMNLVASFPARPTKDDPKTV